MGKRTTFFTIDRKLLEDETWLAEPFTKGQAWVDLIGRASYEDGALTKRGQILVSERGLSMRWKWTGSKVRRFLQKLEADGMITRSSNRSGSRSTWGSILTIENYDSYQTPRSNNRSDDRSDGRHLYNNINNLNKNLSLMSADETDELLQSYSPEALADLEQDVRDYYENHSDKTFPGWIKAIKQFDRNQKRWRAGQPGQPRKRKSKSTEDLIRELQAEEEQQ